MKEIAEAAQQPLESQAVAAVWLRMLEHMYVRERAITASHGRRAVPHESQLAEDGLHQVRPPVLLCTAPSPVASPP